MLASWYIWNNVVLTFIPSNVAYIDVFATDIALVAVLAYATWRVEGNVSDSTPVISTLENY